MVGGVSKSTKKPSIEEQELKLLGALVKTTERIALALENARFGRRIDRIADALDRAHPKPKPAKPAVTLNLQAGKPRPE
jgi:hypothetical protein